MDPLSIGASVITVVGVARKVSSLLKRFKALRRADKELDDLIAEVAQFEHVVEAVRNAPWMSNATVEAVTVLLEKANGKLVEFQSLIEYRLTKAGDSDQVDAWQWTHSGRNVDSLRGALKNTIANLNTLIGVDTRTNVHTLSLEMQQMSFDQQRMIQQFTTAISLFTREIEASQSIRTNMIGLLGPSFRQVSEQPSSEPSTTAVGHGQHLGSNTDSVDHGHLTKSHTVHVQAIQSENVCHYKCRCTCHSTRWKRLSGRLPRLLGCGYIMTNDCNILSCQRSFAPQTKIEYFLPTWLATRVFSLSFTSSPSHSPELLVRFPRLIERDEGFQAIREGNIGLLKSAMTSGDCTPFDINERGESLLDWTIAFDEMYLMLFLLDVGGHSIRNQFTSGLYFLQPMRSPLDAFWAYHICSRTHKPREQLMMGNCYKHVIPFVDWDESCENASYTVLHRIACRIDGHDLESRLKVYPEDIDRLDRLGRSPLWYCVKNGDTHQVRLLLERGANPNVGAEEPLGEAVSNGDVEMMKLLLDPGSIRYPISIISAQVAGAWTDISENPEIDNLLLKHGLDVNLRSYKGRTPLMECCRREVSSRVDRLIAHGADVDVVDEGGLSAVHHAIIYSQSNMLRLLVTRNLRLDNRTTQGDTIMHLGLLFAQDSKLIKQLHKLDFSNIMFDGILDAKNEDGHTAHDLLKQRNGLEWEGWYCYTASGYAKMKWRASSVEKERQIIYSFEALLHQIQDAQGVPRAKQYPPLVEYMSSTTDEEAVPGAWPVCDDLEEV